MVGWTVGDILARADDWMDEWSCSFRCVEGQRLEKPFLHSAVQINNAGMYAHTAAHQQAMRSVVVKERKKTEKKFIRNKIR